MLKFIVHVPVYIFIVLTKWQRSIQIIFYGILSDTKQYLLHLRIEKKIFIFLHLQCVLSQSDIHGYAWNFNIMKDLFNGYEIQIQDFHALKRIESSNTETVFDEKKSSVV